MNIKKYLSVVLLAVFITISPFAGETRAAVSPANTNAVKVGENLKKQTAAFKSKVSVGDIYEIDRAYDAFSNNIKSVEAAIGKVSGALNRSALNKTFVVPAKIERERVIYEVSQIRLMGKISQSVNVKNFISAKSDLAKLGRLKNRAVAIKAAGGYAALPASVNKELAWFESFLSKALKNSYLLNDKGQFIYIDYDAVTKHTTVNGVGVGDSMDKIQYLLGKPSSKDDGTFHYEYKNSIYGESIYLYFENNKVDLINYENTSPKGDGVTKEFINAFEGDIYKNSDAMNQDYETVGGWLFLSKAKEFIAFDIITDGSKFYTDFYIGRSSQELVDTLSDYIKVDKAAAISGQVYKK